MTRQAGGGSKGQKDDRFNTALAKLKVAIEAGCSNPKPYLQILNAMQQGLEGHVESDMRANVLPECGSKPVHTVWFGQPADPDKPYFGCDTVAAIAYDRELADDPDAQVHFWCLPEWVEHYKDYFSRTGSSVTVHSLNEIIHDFPEIEQVEQLILQLGQSENLNHQWLKQSIGNLFQDYKTVVRKSHGLFNPQFLHASQDYNQQNLQAAFVMIRDHLLHSQRRSIRDLVSLKDLFVLLLLVQVGGLFADMTALPLSDEKFTLDKVRTFLPIMECAYDQRDQSMNFVPDIFYLALSVPGSVELSQYEESLRVAMINQLFSQASTFSPSGYLSRIFPKDGVYDRCDHRELERSSAEILDALTVRVECSQDEYQRINQTIMRTGSFYINREGKVQAYDESPIDSDVMMSVFRDGEFCYGTNPVQKQFMGSHHGLDRDPADLYLENYEDVVAERQEYLYSANCDLTPCDESPPARESYTQHDKVVELISALSQHIQHRGSSVFNDSPVKVEQGRVVQLLKSVLRAPNEREFNARCGELVSYSQLLQLDSEAVSPLSGTLHAINEAFGSRQPSQHGHVHKRP